MAERNETPPPGVQIVPDDVNQEINKIEKRAHKKLVQKIMDDPEFGKKLRDDPATLADESLAEELGLTDEVEGHAAWRSKWRHHSSYGWMHYTRGLGWYYAYKPRT